MSPTSRAAGIVVLAALSALCACASIIGLESVGYDGDPARTDGGDGGPDAALPLDANDSGCDGVPCSARCCAKGAVCIDSGICSNDVVDVSGGGTSSCALIADGRVYCWGENALGQVGVSDAGDQLCTFIQNGDAAVTEPCRWNATLVDTLPPASSVAAGGQLACAIASDGGAVWCWGRNKVGALGHAPAADPSCLDVDERAPDGAPTPVACNPRPQQVPGIAGAVELAVGKDTVCARVASGTVLCWGDGGQGERGDGEGGTTSAPVEVVGLPHDIVQIATPLFVPATCAVSATGGAWCWGGGLPLQAGSFTAEAVTGGTGAPLTDLAEIRPAVGFTCARRRTDGTVICWGSNSQGDLGRGDCAGGELAADSVVALPTAVHVDARWSHVCALAGDGILRCWGFAQDGALGVDGIMGAMSCTPKPVRPTPAIVPNLPRITRIATGVETTFAVGNDGSLWAWGANDLARSGHPPKTLGDLTNCGDVGNKTTCNPVPMRVLGLP